MITFSLDGKPHEYDEDRISVKEVRDLKRVTGYGYQEFWTEFANMDPDCIAGLVWLARRRAGEPDLKFSDVDFDFQEFITSMGSDKVEETDDESDPPAADDETTSQ